jgi:hypothetical protein
MSTTAAKQQAHRVSLPEFYDRTWLTRTFGSRSAMGRGRPRKPIDVHFVSSVIGWNTSYYHPWTLLGTLSEEKGVIGKDLGWRGEVRAEVFLNLYHKGNYRTLVERSHALDAGIPKPRVLAKWSLPTVFG